MRFCLLVGYDAGSSSIKLEKDLFSFLCNTNGRHTKEKRAKRYEGGKKEKRHRFSAVEKAEMSTSSGITQVFQLR